MPSPAFPYLGRQTPWSICEVKSSGCVFQGVSRSWQSTRGPSAPPVCAGGTIRHDQPGVMLLASRLSRAVGREDPSSSAPGAHRKAPPGDRQDSDRAVGVHDQRWVAAGKGGRPLCTLPASNRTTGKLTSPRRSSGGEVHRRSGNCGCGRWHTPKNDRRRFLGRNFRGRRTLRSGKPLRRRRQR
jgi:hypothetical protein